MMAAVSVKSPGCRSCTAKSISASCSVPNPFCRLSRRTPGTAPAARIAAERRRCRSRRYFCSALPGNANLETGNRLRQGAALFHEIGSADRYGTSAGMVSSLVWNARQAEQGARTAKGGRGAPTGTRYQYPGSGPEGQQRPGHSKITRAAALLEQWGVTDELDHVAQALFGLEQDGAAGQRRAVPERLGQRPGMVLPGKRYSYSGQPLSKSPSASQIRARLLRVSAQSGLSRNASSKRASRLVEPAHVLQCQAQVIQPLHVLRIQTQGLLIRSRGLGQLPRIGKRNAEVIVGIGRGGLQPDGRDRLRRHPGTTWPATAQMPEGCKPGAGLELNRFAKAGNGFVQLSLRG